MAVINKKYGYVFLEEPHTGSRACVKALLQHEGSVRDRQHEFVKAQRCTAFSVVRHPLDVLATYYHHDKRTFFEVLLAHIKRSRDFDRVIKEIAENMQTFDGSRIEAWGRVYGKRRPGFFYHAHRGHRLLRYENGLEKEVNGFLESIDTPRVDFEIVNPTERKKPWWAYFNQHTIRIAEVLLTEIREYGYTTNFYWENQ